MLALLITAAKMARSNDPNDQRNFILGAVGVRKDGARVYARNGAVVSSSYENYRIISDAHAECRVIRKLGKDGTIYVARILKLDGTLAMARPCGICQMRALAAQVKKVIYSINENHYGIFYPDTQTDRIYEVIGEQARIRFGNQQASSGLNFSGAA